MAVCTAAASTARLWWSPVGAELLGGHYWVPVWVPLPKIGTATAMGTPAASTVSVHVLRGFQVTAARKYVAVSLMFVTVCMSAALPLMVADDR